MLPGVTVASEEMLNLPTPVLVYRCLPAMRRAEEASSPGKMDVDTDHLQNKGRRCIVSVCYSLLVVRVGPLVIQHTRTPFQL